MTSNADFKYLGTLKKDNKVRILTDKSCSMKAVFVNDHKVMEGNYNDFYNGCHGYYDLPNFISAGDLAAVLIKKINQKGFNAELIMEEYKFNW